MSLFGWNRDDANEERPEPNPLYQAQEACVLKRVRPAAG